MRKDYVLVWDNVHVTIWVYESHRYVFQLKGMSDVLGQRTLSCGEGGSGFKLWLSMPSVSAPKRCDIGLPWAYHWQFQVAHWWWRVSLKWRTTTRPLWGSSFGDGMPCGFFTFLLKDCTRGNRMWGQKLRKVKETPSILARASPFLCCNKIVTKGITHML